MTQVSNSEQWQIASVVCQIVGAIFIPTHASNRSADKIAQNVSRSPPYIERKLCSKAQLIVRLSIVWIEFVSRAVESQPSVQVNYAEYIGEYVRRGEIVTSDK